MMITCVMAVADKPDSFGVVCSEKTLREVAEDLASDGFWFDDESKALMWKGSIGKELSIKSIPSNPNAVVQQIVQE